MEEQRVTTTPFPEPDKEFNLFGSHRYTKDEIRSIWEAGVEYGIRLGLDNASLAGQRISLERNTSNPRHKEFLTKFYALCQEYNCAIQHNEKYGMSIISLSPLNDKP